jgi:ribosomal protein L4
MSNENRGHDGADRCRTQGRSSASKLVSHRSTIAVDRRRCANQPGEQRARQAMACCSGGPRWRGGHQHHDPGQKRDLHEAVDKKKKVVHVEMS